jgi:hypothetical protein
MMEARMLSNNASAFNVGMMKLTRGHGKFSVRDDMM